MGGKREAPSLQRYWVQMGNGQSDTRSAANVVVSGMKQSGKKALLAGLSELFGSDGATKTEAYGAGKTVSLKTINCDGMDLSLGVVPLEDLKDGANFSKLQMYMQSQRPDPTLGHDRVDAVIIILDAKTLGSDYRLKDKVYSAVEKPLRTMMMKGGCKNAVVLFLVNKYDTLRKDKQSDDDYMGVVAEAANQCAVQMKWTASLVMAANCFSVKAEEKETLRPAITWLCTVLAHTGPIKE